MSSASIDPLPVLAWTLPFTRSISISPEPVSAWTRSPIAEIFKTTRAGVGFERPSDALHRLITRASLDSQLGFRGDGHFIADGNVVPQFRVVNVADADVIAALLDGRVGLQPLDLVLGISSEPFRARMRPVTCTWLELPVRTSTSPDPVLRSRCTGPVTCRACAETSLPLRPPPAER